MRATSVQHKPGLAWLVLMHGATACAGLYKYTLGVPSQDKRLMYSLLLMVLTVNLVRVQGQHGGRASKAVKQPNTGWQCTTKCFDCLHNLLLQVAGSIVNALFQEPKPVTQTQPTASSKAGGGASQSPAPPQAKDEPKKTR